MNKNRNNSELIKIHVMYNKIRLLMVLLLTLFAMQIYSQQIKQTTFTLEEYKIKDTVFYNELCTVLFSDTVFGTKTYLEWHTKKLHNRFYFAMSGYDTNFVHIDDETDETFSANFNIFQLMDGHAILGATKEGKGVIGYFYILNKNMICFILDLTHSDFVHQYFTPTKRRRQFTIQDWFVFGGFTDVYMNILPNNKIEIVRIFRSE